MSSRRGLEGGLVVPVAELERRLRALEAKALRRVSAGAWQTPTLDNGWSNVGGSNTDVGYRTEPGGLVRLRGAITGGTDTDGTVLFTLPSGFRPAATETFVGRYGNPEDVARIDVTPGGDVEVYGASGGDATFLSLSGIAFHADG